MARPTRTNADYFPHSANYRNDRRVKAIRAKFGASGYGILLMLLEVLADSDGIQLDTGEIELELLSGDLGVSVTEIDSLLQSAEKIGLFTRNSANNLICPDLNKDLEPVFEKRNRAKQAFQEKQKGVSVTETNDSATENTQSKVEESRGEESKEKKEDKDTTQSQESSVAEGTEPAQRANSESIVDPIPAQKKDPPPPPPNSGDGRLRQSCLDFNTANPGKYRPDMYKAFIEHWTAPVINGTPAQVGKELWEIQTTWPLARKLAIWHERDKINGQQPNQSNSRKSADFLRDQQQREPAKNGYGKL